MARNELHFLLSRSYCASVPVRREVNPRRLDVDEGLPREAGDVGGLAPDHAGGWRRGRVRGAVAGGQALWKGGREGVRI